MQARPKQDEQPSQAVAKIAERRLDHFNVQEIANTARAVAVATASRANVRLFNALTWAAEWCIGDMSEQGVSMTF